MTRKHGFGAAGQCSASVVAGGITMQLFTVQNDRGRFEWQEPVRVCVPDEKVYEVSKRVKRGVVHAGGSSLSIMCCRLASQCV